MPSALATTNARLSVGLIATAVRWVSRRWLSTSGAVQDRRPTPERDFGAYLPRRARYAVCWSLYENTAYDREVHAWAEGQKVDRGLYPHIKNIFTIVYRLVEFSATHIYGGAIDPDCGDGKSVPSAIPIVTDNPDLRPAIARVFKAKNFDAEKTVLARIGAALGDVGIFAYDDTLNGRPYLDVVDPNTIVDYRESPDGSPESYVLEEWRPDPRPGAATDIYGIAVPVIYREEAEVVRGVYVGDTLQEDDSAPVVACRFRTFIDSGYDAYAWPGNPADDWTEPYPFLPLTLIAHSKVIPGCPFGQAEALPALSKIREVDEVASRFHGHIAKAVDAIWLLKGFSTSPKMASDLPADALKAIVGGPEAGAQALLSGLDLSHVDGHLKMLIDELKDDFPELRRDIESAAGDASGTALRMSLARCEAKYQTRRAGYDAGLTRAITQCLRIGGIREYEGFEAYAPELVAADPQILAFRIDDRPVFRPDPKTQLDLETAFLANCESADRAGIPVTAYLEITGRKDWLEVVLRERQKMLDAGLPVGRAKQAPPPNDPAAQAIQAPGGSAP